MKMTKWLLILHPQRAIVTLVGSYLCSHTVVAKLHYAGLDEVPLKPALSLGSLCTEHRRGQLYGYSQALKRKEILFNI